MMLTAFNFISAFKGTFMKNTSWKCFIHIHICICIHMCRVTMINRGKEREKERPFTGWLILQMVAVTILGCTKFRTTSFIQVSHMSAETRVLGPSSSTFSKCVAKELYRKWSTLDINWCSCSRQQSNPTMSQHYPRNTTF